MPISTDILKKYLSPVFIETGSFWGQGINCALAVNFSEIYSIELSEKYYNICKNKFILNSNVHLILGDSAGKLQEVISTIDDQITFWLDAHSSGGDTAMGKSVSSLMQELESLKGHKFKNHKILMDDVRLWHDYKFSVEEVKEKILEINPSYTFLFENGHQENDILVALA